MRTFVSVTLLISCGVCADAGRRVSRGRTRNGATLLLTAGTRLR